MAKMDGLTCSLHYVNGHLISAETRGDGEIGEDILHNALVISSIPKKIEYTDELVIDGEIICTYSDFQKWSDEYKNPRNFASGSIRLLNSKECFERNLTFVAWDIINTDLNRLSEKIDLLANLNFKVVPYRVLEKDTPISESFIEDISEEASLLSYPIDGIVFKYNNTIEYQKAGRTAHHFKGGIAYKFSDDTYETKLIDIQWQLGRTGVFTPVAIFEPVEIEGSSVEKASLHNVSIVKEILGFPHRGQRVEVAKCNQIIPQIIRADRNLDEDSPENLTYPEKCPYCQMDTEFKVSADDVINLYCTNPSCEGGFLKRLIHFCGKKGLDIKGLSDKTLEKLVSWGWVSSLSDIFCLIDYKKEWVQKPGFGEASVSKILDAIEENRKCDLENFIAALGIPLIGNVASKQLASTFKTWENFIGAVREGFNFTRLPNIGYEMHTAISNFDYREADELATNHIFFNKIENIIQENSLKNMTFVITGKLKGNTRDGYKKEIERLGGKLASAVSSKTNYLINNDVNSTSQKNKTAKELGIPIITEEMFINQFLKKV
jgi:DNA ligase (NAD+)